MSYTAQKLDFAAILDNEHGAGFFRVAGDSLDGFGLPDGSIVLLKVDAIFDDGALVAVERLADGATFLRRYTSLPGGRVMLSAGNPAHRPLFVHQSEIRVHAVAVAQIDFSEARR